MGVRVFPISTAEGLSAPSWEEGIGKIKLTPWFPISIKPARNGVYQVRTRDGANLPWLSEYRKGYWLGTVGGHRTIEEASEFGRRHGPTYCDLTEWRGLAKEPK